MWGSTRGFQATLSLLPPFSRVRCEFGGDRKERCKGTSWSATRRRECRSVRSAANHTELDASRFLFFFWAASLPCWAFSEVWVLPFSCTCAEIPCVYVYASICFSSTCYHVSAGRVKPTNIYVCICVCVCVRMWQGATIKSLSFLLLSIRPA
jgi:hypothetical protein